MLSEKELEVFVKGAQQYFQTVANKPVEIEAPYLVATEDIEVNDYTGIIGISGERKGCVFVTASKEMLRYLVLSLGETEADDALVRDVIGEVTNTISGNARSEFGAGFMISVPVVIAGKPDMIAVPNEVNGYVIPIRWDSFSLLLVVSLV